LIQEESGAKQKVLMLGDEAIARGAVEAGVRFVASYPGTPSTEITVKLAEYGKKLGFHVEWSANEKVAFEAAYGASLSGLRAFVGTKHLGMNVLSDSLLVAAYGGTRAGLVIAVADDTHPYSSQNAMDSRHYCRLVNVPCVEPSDPNEAKEAAKFAFDLSERYSLPVILRITQRLAHARGAVELDEIPSNQDVTAEFQRDRSRFVLLARQAFERRRWLIQQMNVARRDLSSSGQRIFDSGDKLGIIGVGIGTTYVLSIATELGLSDLSMMKLSVTNPLPEESILSFANEVSELLVLEDGDPIVEREIRNLLQMNCVIKRVHGKDDGVIGFEGELTPDKIVSGLHALGLVDGETRHEEKIDVIPRIAGLCAGCPHRASYFVIKEVLSGKGGGIVTGDRGCYNQGANFPIEAFDTCMDMGASVGIAYGLAKSGVDRPIVAVIGDSTFFHAGLPALENAVVNQAAFTIALLDNGWTSMTGQQPSFTTGIDLMGQTAPIMKPEDIAMAMGVKCVKVVDPLDVELAKQVFREALEQDEVSVVIFRRECALQELRRIRAAHRKIEPYFIDPEKCTGCRVCLMKTGCPALRFDGGKMSIDQSDCTGCGLCVYACKYDAIHKGRS